jgi:hypothetical protein
MSKITEIAGVAVAQGFLPRYLLGKIAEMAH